jgi:hypothetical protein
LPFHTFTPWAGAADVGHRQQIQRRQAAGRPRSWQTQIPSGSEILLLCACGSSSGDAHQELDPRRVFFRSHGRGRRAPQA